MNVMMLLDFVYVDKTGIQYLKKNHVYEMPDEWGKLMVQEQIGAEYIVIK